MPYEVVFDEQNLIVRSTFHGEIHVEESLSSISVILGKAQENDCFLLLLDFREARLRLSIVELYKFPRALMQFLKPSGFYPVHYKFALVISNDLDKFSFFETVMLNFGQRNKTFQHIDEAIEWLLSE